MKPEDVKPNNFNVQHIVFNDQFFSIAYGEWIDDGETVLAMRWNGADGKNGYPNDRHGQPLWFKVSESLTDIFLNSLLLSPNADKKSIMAIYNS